MQLFKRMAITLVVVAITAYVALIVLALYSDRVIFQPQPSTYKDSDLARPGGTVNANTEVRVVKAASGDGAITAIYLPNPAATHTLLFSHGNAEDLGDDLPLLEMYRNAGFAVFAYDYRGYGTSAGTPSESSTYQDVLAAYDYLTRDLRVSPERVISFGRSVGAAMAIELAVQRPVSALIVEAPFVSAFRVLTRVPLLPWDKFRNGDKIKRVHCPVLVIHGRADRVIPFRHGLAIFAMANEPKRALWVDGGGHNDLVFAAGKTYFDALREFASWAQGFRR